MMNAYRTNAAPPLEIERPWFPKLLEFVRIGKTRDNSTRRHEGRIGWVSIITPDGVYLVSFSRRSGSGCGFFWADELQPMDQP
jgi:hypothetical protein